jgi:hypothetical protein
MAGSNVPVLCDGRSVVLLTSAMLTGSTAIPLAFFDLCRLGIDIDDPSALPSGKDEWQREEEEAPNVTAFGGVASSRLVGS